MLVQSAQSGSLCYTVAKSQVIKLSACVDEVISNYHTVVSDEGSVGAKLHLRGNVIKIPSIKANNNRENGQCLASSAPSLATAPITTSFFLTLFD